MIKISERKICFLLFAFAFFFFLPKLHGEGGNIALTKGPLSVPFFAMEKEDSKVKVNHYYSFSETITSLLRGECDFASFPVDSAYRIFLETKGKIVCAGTTGSSSFYVVSHLSELTDVSNLSGRKLFASKNSLSFKLLKEILSKNNIEIEKTKNGVQIIQTKDENDLVSGFLEKKYAIVLVSRPFLNLIEKYDDNKIYKIDLQKEYSSIVGKNAALPVSLLMVNKSFAEDDPSFCSEILNDISENYFSSEDFQSIENYKLDGIYNTGYDMEDFLKLLKENNYSFSFASSSKKNIVDSLKIFAGEKNPSPSFFLNESQ